jgi:hypothetical protein
MFASITSLTASAWADTNPTFSTGLTKSEGRKWFGPRVLKPPDRRPTGVLQLGGVPEIHFFFNLYSICINRRYANLECIGTISRAVWPCPIKFKIRDQLNDQLIQILVLTSVVVRLFNVS